MLDHSGQEDAGIRWGRVIALSAILTVVIVGLVAYRVVTREHELRPLTEILWVKDTQGFVHGPTTEVVRTMLLQIESRGIDIQEPRYRSDILVQLESTDTPTNFVLMLDDMIP
ncbi:MAG: hypothetical protein KJ626_10300 [Verrucomicrobia bacterium]|nr:hypothetical protein [Verrucomicrobiota bacterium]